MGKSPRYVRLHRRDKPSDQRTDGQRDRDRVLYSSAFRRLGGVTQVALARDEGLVLHNRLTHSLKVAQIGRRVAEMLLTDASAADSDRMRKRGGLDPEVVEAAALAHDLGHPPFGHIAEEELCALVRRAGIEEGFEGNAQSFRIVTDLSRVASKVPTGLNLTRATLNAILKYPWLWDPGDPNGRSADVKWGCYREDTTAFQFARKYPRLPDRSRCLEAEVMDWADDITYAVHDVEDFYRAGLIPLHGYRGARRPDLDALFRRAKRIWYTTANHPVPSDEELWAAAVNTIATVPVRRPFDGRLRQRAELRDWTGWLIGRFVQSTSFNENGLSLSRSHEIEVVVLKALTKMHVVENPLLQTQQFGQRRVIRDLFLTYSRCIRKGDRSAFPGRVTEELDSLLTKGSTPETRTRFVSDLIAGMTEEQALRTHHRLTGVDLGPLLDPAVA